MAKVSQANDDDVGAPGAGMASEDGATPKAPSASVSYKRPRSSVPLGEQQLPPQAIAASGRGFRTVLRNRLFLRLWLAQLISQTIMNAMNYGLVVLVAATSKSNFATSLSIVTFALPAAIFAPLAGVLVDRFNRRTVMWISNLLRAMAAVAIAISLHLDFSPVVIALLLSLFTSSIGQFFTPAEGAAIPLLVHPDELVNALSLFNITFTISQALGLIVLGPAIILFVPTITIGHLSMTSIESLFVIVALLYGVCIGLIFSIPKPRLQSEAATGAHALHLSEGHQVRHILMGIREAASFVRHDRRLLNAILQLCMGGVVVAIVSAIAPNFVHVFFNQPQSNMVLVLFPAGVGLVLGSAFTPALVRKLHYIRTIMIGLIALSTSIALLTLVRAIVEAIHPQNWWASWWYWGIAILLTFFIGIALNFVNVPTTTTMQARSPDWIKGRVLALQSMLQNGMNVLILPLMGLAADAFGIPLAMDVLAVVVLTAGLTSIYFGTLNRSSASAQGGEPTSRSQPQSQPHR